METLTLIATLLPMAVSSGINLYATILVAGIAIQFNWVEGIPSGLNVLGAWPVNANRWVAEVKQNINKEKIIWKL